MGCRSSKDKDTASAKSATDPKSTAGAAPAESQAETDAALARAAELARLLQLRAANQKAEAQGKQHFYQSVEHFRTWVKGFRADPPAFHEADNCEHPSCGEVGACLMKRTVSGHAHRTHA